MQKDFACLCILSLPASDGGPLLRTADVCGCPGEEHFSHHDCRIQIILSSGRRCVESFFFFFFYVLLSVTDPWPLTPDPTNLLSFASGQQTITIPHGDVTAFNLKIVGISSACLCWCNSWDGREGENHFCTSAGRNEQRWLEDEEHQHTILSLLHHIYKLLWLFST